MSTWRSKLGNKYDKATIEKYNLNEGKRELDRLRRLPENRHCVECNSEHVVWASVNLGVFLCIQCGSHHRGIGTHISKPKGCTGTYLWGPDEIERMRSIGNARATEIYGPANKGQCPSRDAAYAAWRQYLVDKYEHHKFAPPQHNTPTQPKQDNGAENTSTIPKFDSTNQQTDFFAEFEGTSSKGSESFPSQQVDLFLAEFDNVRNQQVNFLAEFDKPASTDKATHVGDFLGISDAGCDKPNTAISDFTNQHADSFAEETANSKQQIEFFAEWGL